MGDEPSCDEDDAYLDVDGIDSFMGLMDECDEALLEPPVHIGDAHDAREDEREVCSATVAEVALSEAPQDAPTICKAPDLEEVARLGCTVRGRLEARLGGQLQCCAQYLITLPPSEEEAILILLCALEPFTEDIDCAALLGVSGVHRYLKGAMAGARDTSPRVQEAAAELVARICGSGCMFPMEAQPLVESESFRPPLRYHLGAEVSHSEDEAQGRHEGEGAVEIVLRRPPEQMSEHFDVGFVMWSAAVVLARWLHLHRPLLRGRSVLEVGAGLGLCGIAAAYSARQVGIPASEC